MFKQFKERMFWLFDSYFDIHFGFIDCLSEICGEKCDCDALKHDNIVNKSFDCV